MEQMTITLDVQTEFTFEQLDDGAKERAREAERNDCYGDNWWEWTYEYAVRIGALMGIEIGTRTVQGFRGKQHDEIDINFSGFGSQGDGACFRGWYRYKPDAVASVKSEAPQDEELLRIATELTVAQVAFKLTYGSFVKARVTTGGHYSHSGTMNLDIEFEDDNFVEPIFERCYDDIGEDLQPLIRDFVDWIYHQLEAESDYLGSDEVIDERLSDGVLFDESGARL